MRGTAFPWGQDFLRLAHAQAIAEGGKGPRVGSNTRTADDGERVRFIAIGGVEGNAACPERLYDVEVVELIGNRKCDDGEVGERPLGL